MSCSLYRFYDEGDRLLYVGITTQACARLAQHAADKDWFPKVARSTFAHYPTRGEAEAAEKAAIKSERPVYNLRHAPDRDSVPRRGEMDVAEVAAYLRVDADTVTRWVNFDRIPHRRRKNGTVVFRKARIEAWLLSLRNRQESA